VHLARAAARRDELVVAALRLLLQANPAHLLIAAVGRLLLFFCCCCGIGVCQTMRSLSQRKTGLCVCSNSHRDDTTLRSRPREAAARRTIVAASGS
jgi:hypothetical protein